MVTSWAGREKWAHQANITLLNNSSQIVHQSIIDDIPDTACKGVCCVQWGVFQVLALHTTQL